MAERQWHPLAAGIAGGAISTIALYPLDLLKVRLQVNEGRLSPSLNSNGTIPAAASTTSNSGRAMIVRDNMTMTRALVNVIRHEGFFGLYQGLTPALLGSATSWGGYFFLYERIKYQWTLRKSSSNGNHHKEKMALQIDPSVKLGPLEHFVSSCLAGAAMVLVTNPIWLIKTRMQLQMKNLLLKQQQQILASNCTKTTASIKAPYMNMIDAIRTILREEGFWALYKGSIPAMMLVSHGGVQFVAYEWLKTAFGTYTARTRQQNSDKIKISSKSSIQHRFIDSMGYLTMGAVSKIIASTVTYPLQVIKSRLQQRSQALEITESGQMTVVKRQYAGVIDCIIRIWQREGIAGFFKGCLTNALRVAPSAAITFVVYESFMDFFATS